MLARTPPISCSMTRSALPLDRKSTRLNSIHLVISYAVFCLKKKKQNIERRYDDREESHEVDAHHLRQHTVAELPNEPSRYRHDRDGLISHAQCIKPPPQRHA